MSQQIILRKIIYFLFSLTFLATVFGELHRLSIGGMQLLPTDLAVPLLLGFWGLDKLKNDRKLRVGKITKTIAVFLFVMLTVYTLNFLRFDTGELLGGLTYLARLLMYSSLALVAFDLMDRDANGHFRKTLLKSMLASLFLISILGFLQLKYFPSFFDLELYLEGWDPHIGRLLSTWFDPNFVGGFFGFMLPVAFSLSLYHYRQKNRRMAYLLAAVALCALIALYLTYSRSAYLTLIVGMGTFTLFKSRQLLVALLIFLVLGFGVSARVQERTLDAVDSAKSLIGIESQKPLDPTSQFRVDSWKIALSLIEDHPILGVGYGRYAQEVHLRGQGIGLNVHSASGSDSSLLTLWAQAGIIGLLSYMAIIFVATVVAIKQIWKKNNYNSYLILGLLSGFAGMMVHSFFVNSLLFALMMVYLWVGLALMDER